MNQAADRTELIRYVEDALAHAYDHFYLQLHPLGGILLPEAAAELRGRALSRLLIDAVDRLKPGPGVPQTSPAWRKYRYLSLRYVENLSPELVCAQLGISDRQGRRDNRQALEALSALLLTTESIVTVGGISPSESERLSEAPGESPSNLDDELIRVASVAPRIACDLAEAINGALVTVRPLVATSARQIQVDLPATRLRVAVNPLILRQLLIALLSCAIDLSQDSSVLITAKSAGPQTTLIVQIVGTLLTTQAELLSTSQQLATLQGARLDLVQDAEILRLTLSLPVAEHATVLVIDDNPDVVLLFRRYLGESYRLIQATTSDDALHQARTTRPTLITLDVMMPGLDGWQILEQLQDDPDTAEIPVIICSILRQPSLATALGASAYLAKPINPQALRSILERQIDQIG